MKKREAELQSRFVQLAKKGLPDFVVIQHRNPSESGTPDLSVTGLGHTSWWELKLARPTVRSRGVQDIMLARLSTRGLARYLIFSEIKGELKTHIVTAEQVQNGSWSKFGYLGWNFMVVFDYIRGLHTQQECQVTCER